MNNSHLIVCPSCFSTNKIPAARLTEGGKCGRCHSILLTGRVISVDTGQFNKFISRCSLPIVVDFWASWCGPCKMMAPIFEQTAKNFQSRITFLKINTEIEQNLSAQYNIRSIPTIALFKQGKEVNRQAGALDSNSLQQWVTTNL